MCAVESVSVRVQVESEALRLRIEIRWHLRIVDEDIDVETFPVADLKHQRSAAAETPAVENGNFELAWLIIFRAWSKSAAQ